MIEEWGPAGRRGRRAGQPVRGDDERTGNAIYDGTDDDGPAQLVLTVLAAVAVLIVIGLVLL
jgi:hypothetical protein